MTQLFELAQFIQKTSYMADATLLMGDLNTEEFEDGFKMLLNHSELLDAFKETTVGKFYYKFQKFMNIFIDLF